MAVANVAVLENRKGGKFSVYFSANGFFVPTGNSTTSNVNGLATTLAINEEVINTATIRSCQWSMSNNAMSWTVARGANTYLTLGGNEGQLDFAGMADSFNFDATANVVATITGTGTAFLILNMQKQSSYNQPE